MNIRFQEPIRGMSIGIGSLNGFLLVPEASVIR
jgi:hypothetical protein